VGHAPLVCESDSEAPPHCAHSPRGPLCMRDMCTSDKGWWSAVSQSRAVVESATGSGNHQHTGPSSTRAWLGCRTSVVQHKQHNVWAWWGSGAPRAPQDEGGGGAGLLRTLQGHRETKEKPSFPRFIWWRKTRARAHQPQWCMAPPRPGPCLPLLKFKLSTHGACRELVW